MDFKTNQSLYIILFWIVAVVVGMCLIKQCKAAKKNLRKKLPNGVYVNNFGIALRIPDMPDKFYEGGFHLYFTSPALNIRKLISYQFEKNTEVKSAFDLQGRHITFDQFQQGMTNSTIHTNSHNVYNAQHVEVFGSLSDGRYFIGSKFLNPTLDRSIDHGHPVTLDQLDFRIEQGA